MKREQWSKQNYESIKQVPTKELVDVLCEAQKEKWAAEYIITVIMAEITNRKEKWTHEE
jgi:hypothetical protein